MVGWLIENQKVWIKQKNVGQGDTLLLASTQLTYFLSKVFDV